MRERLDARRRVGNIRDCIVDNLLDRKLSINISFTDRRFNDLLEFLVAAGSDTTSGFILTSICYLTAHPYV